MKVINKYEPDPARMLAALRYAAERGELRLLQQEQAAQAEAARKAADKAQAQPTESATPAR